MRITEAQLRTIVREMIDQEMDKKIYTTQSSNFTSMYPDTGIMHERPGDGETDEEVIASLRDRLAAKIRREPGIEAGSIFREPKEYGSPVSGKLYIVYHRRGGLRF
jgi:hypothetical protein